jgi:hypothetical protein
MASNWVIPGMVMAGAYPGALDDKENDRQLKSILNKGIDTFVCLQAEVDDEIPEEHWRAGHGLRPYFVDARRLSKVPLIWRHLPIVDGGVSEDEFMEALVCDLLDDLKAGRVLYLHCWGGHGRTGIVACLLLAVLYGLPVSDAFKRVQGYHDARIEPQGVKSPSTVVQRSQVKRMLQGWKNQRENPSQEEALDTQAASPPVAAEPQVVIGQNGARGFVVSAVSSSMERSASMPSVGKKESSELAMRKNHATGLQPKLQTSLHAQPIQAQANANGRFVAERRAGAIPIGTQQSKGAMGARVSAGKGAAGTGAACVKMLRKQTSQLALR